MRDKHMTIDALTERAKALSAKYHWHLDRSLKFRTQLDEGGLTAREHAKIAMKMVDEEAYCQDLDAAISQIANRLRNA